MKVLTFFIFFSIMSSSAMAFSHGELWNSLTQKEKHLSFLSIVKGFEAGCATSSSAKDSFKKCQDIAYGFDDPEKGIYELDKFYTKDDRKCVPWGVAFFLSLTKKYDPNFISSFKCK